MSRKYAQNGLEGLFKQQTMQWPGQFDNREEGIFKYMSCIIN